MLQWNQIPASEKVKDPFLLETKAMGGKQQIIFPKDKIKVLIEQGVEKFTMERFI